MRYAARFVLLLVLSLTTILLASCGQKQNCSGITFGGSGGGGGSSGGLNSGGSACGPGSNNGGGSGSDLLFYRSSNGPDDTIATASLTTTTLSTLPGVAVDVGQSIAESIVIVNKKYLYMPAGNTILGFSINHSTGGLTPLTGSPFPAPSTITTLAVDPDSKGGRFLFAADFTSGDFMEYTIDPGTGALSLVSGSPFLNPNFRVTALLVDGSGNYLYGIAASTTGGVFGYLIDQNGGGISPIAGSPFPVGTGQIQTDPAGAFMLTVAGNANSINVIPIEAGTGVLLLNSFTNYPTADLVSTVSMHPTGNFVYTCGDKGALEGFSYAAGVLTPLAGSPFTSLSNLTGCQFDQAGTALFGIIIRSGAVGVRIVNPTTGDVLGGIPDLPVTTNQYFAVTN
jgi:6-phosphogluconolactonase (cycloisomerase 2 family)